MIPLAVSEYRQKVTSAEKAVQLVRSGDRVYIHHGCASPQVLVQALVNRAPGLRGVELLHMLIVGEAPHMSAGCAGSFRHNGMFLGPNVRGAVAEGRADYTPICLSDVEYLFCSGELPLDVALLQCSPPDGDGFVSLGTGVECMLTAAGCADRVIAEVNDQMPRTCGDTLVHVSRISAIVETSHPLAELRSKPADPVQERIARNVAMLVPDGATLQMGIGGIPDSVWSCLKDHRDLGIHSEMVSDGIVPLVASGVINGARKTLHPGKLVAGFVLGTRTLFDLIDRNPLFEFHPTAYVNDPFVIAQNDNMIAVNSALEIDLTGQVCADSLGTAPYSGCGGQLDFVRGAGRARGGKAIIALPSTAKGGKVSRIAPVLAPGSGVVTPRSDVHYVVTEHGVAYLRGKTIRQRAEALIAIAEPKFRDELYEAAERFHYLAARVHNGAGPWPRGASTSQEVS